MAGILHGIDLFVDSSTLSSLNSDTPSRPSPFRSPSTVKTDEARAALLPTSPAHGVAGCAAKCNERGCVFPAGQHTGKCRQHERQSCEPALFHSKQPSMLLLDQAKFGPPDSGSEQRDWRGRDRQRLRRLWQAFQEGIA